MKMTQPLAFLLLSLFVTGPSFADSLWPQVPGRLLPPFLRHIGVMPLGQTGQAKQMWEGYAKSASVVVVPYDEMGSIVHSDQSPVRVLIDLGNWEFANREALDKRVLEAVKKRGRFGGWILSGDVGSMVTNLAEFSEFRKSLEKAGKDLPLHLACRYQKGTAYTDCLPKSLTPFFDGVIWDVHFPLGFDPTCLGKATSCAADVRGFFDGLLPGALQDLKRDERILNWSLRLPLALLPAAGNPLRLLKAFFAYFVNEPRSLHFIVAMDAAVSKLVIERKAPYDQVDPFLRNLTSQQLQRNLDIGSDIENPLGTDGREIKVTQRKAFGPHGWEFTTAYPYFLNRFVVKFKAGDRPVALSIYASDSDATYYLGTRALPKLTPSKLPVVLYTDPFHFPYAKRVFFTPDKGHLNYAGGVGWVTK